jgi:hypothetical protein
MLFFQSGWISQCPQTLGVDQTCLAGRSALTGLSGMSAFCWRTHLTYRKNKNHFKRIRRVSVT